MIFYFVQPQVVKYYWKNTTDNIHCNHEPRLTVHSVLVNSKIERDSHLISHIYLESTVFEISYSADLICFSPFKYFIGC